MIIVEITRKALEQERNRLLKILFSDIDSSTYTYIRAALSVINWVDNGGDSPSKLIERDWHK